MENWAGFSDADLRKLRSTNGPGAQRPRETSSNKKSSSVKQTLSARKLPAQNNENERFKIQSDMLLSSKPTSTATTKESQMKMKSGNMLQGQSQSHGSSSSEPDSNNRNVSPVAGTSHQKTAEPQKQKEESQVKPSTDLPSPAPTAEVKELDEKQYLDREMTNLEKYRMQQKHIEEQNKRKRQMLTNTIKQRRERAMQENSRLVKVQKELERLDSLLSVDVSIIRDKIEWASLEYMEAQKRYERAEEEFVKAKLDLHSKLENKEQLTEHLYTIIHQNEVRKAEKLTSLMEVLSVEPGEEGSVAGCSLADMVPQLGLVTMADVVEKQHQSFVATGHLNTAPASPPPPPLTTSPGPHSEPPTSSPSAAPSQKEEESPKPPPLPTNQASSASDNSAPGGPTASNEATGGGGGDSDKVVPPTVESTATGTTKCVTNHAPTDATAQNHSTTPTPDDTISNR